MRNTALLFLILVACGPVTPAESTTTDAPLPSPTTSTSTDGATGAVPTTSNGTTTSTVTGATTSATTTTSTGDLSTSTSGTNTTEPTIPDLPTDCEPIPCCAGCGDGPCSGCLACPTEMCETVGGLAICWDPTTGTPVCAEPCLKVMCGAGPCLDERGQFICAPTDCTPMPCGPPLCPPPNACGKLPPGPPNDEVCIVDGEVPCAAPMG